MKKQKLSKLIILSFVSFHIIITGYSTNQIPFKDNSFCLRCHGMKTLSYIEEPTGMIRSLFVDSTKFIHSNHKNLKCTNCHNQGFDIYPHNFPLESEKLQCTKCHKDDPKFEKFHFNEIEEEFKRSIHYINLEGKFDCFSCHNPHEFEISEQNQNIQYMIQKDNSICLKCHESSLAFSKVTDKKFIDLKIAHSWLPNLESHWKNVMCINCHTPNNTNTSHQSHEILGVEKAEKNCVSCHSTNSILMTKLYKYQTKESNQKNGFINSRALNQSYTIGMTRNLYLDKLSVIIFIFTFIGIFGHAIGVRIGKKRINQRINK